jgi:hypothetical protein
MSAYRISKILSILTILSPHSAGVRATESTLPSKLIAKVWATRDAENPKQLPDQPVYPERDLLSVGRGESLGICFSGGGTMAATCAVAQLAALKKMGVLPHVDYVSSVSGGTWGVLPFIFLTPEAAANASIPSLRDLTQDQLDERYLGREVAPEDLTSKVLLEEPQLGSIQHIVTHTRMGLSLLGLKGDENYAHIVGRSFLAPLGLGDEKRFIAPTRDYMNGIISRNQGRGKLAADSFYIPAPGRPFLIANGSTQRALPGSAVSKIAALLRIHVATPKAYWPLEMTSLYTGNQMWVARYINLLPTQLTRGPLSLIPNGRELGGGYVETFAFDGKFKRWTNSGYGTEAEVHLAHNLLWPRRGRPFSLSDMMAASGAAPGAAWSQFFDHLGYSAEFRTFSPAKPEQTRSSNKERTVVDGGATDNLGLAPLLARNCKRVIVFANSCGVFEEADLGQRCDTSGQCETRAPGTEGDHYKFGLGTPITSLFGAAGTTGWRNSVLQQPTTNHLLDNHWSPQAQGPKINRLLELSEAFSRLAKAGKPLVYTGTYRTTDGSRTLTESEPPEHNRPGRCPSAKYGVSPGHQVTICWVYLSATRADFIRRADDIEKPSVCAWDNDPWLRRVAARDIFFDADKLRRNELTQFPNLKVFCSNGINPQRLNNVQANALYHYARFNTASSAAELRKMIPR